MRLGMEYDIIIRVLTTEKTAKDVAFGKQTFIVETSASRDDVKKAIEKIFGVEVERVNTSQYEGKSKRYHGKSGKRKSVKKAIVSVKKGQIIDLSKLEE